MWKFLTSIVSGGLGSIFGGYLDYRNVKSRIEGEVLHRYMEAEIETNRQKVMMNRLMMERWETRWIIPGFAFIMMFHVGAVVLDSVFMFENWQVAALPGPIADWEGQIILSFFVVVPAKDLISRYLDRGLVQSVVTNVKKVFNRSKK